LLLIAVGLSAPLLVQLMAPNPALLDHTVLYLRIELFGGLPAVVNATLVGCFRGLGDTRTPLLAAVVIECLNLLLDVLLIFGMAGLPRLGIAGVALATVSAAALGTVLLLGLFVQRGRREGWLVRWWLPFDRHVCWHLVRVSWPVGVHGALDMAAWTLFTALMARLGTVEAAAHTIAMRMLAMAYMAGSGIAVAATTLVGQYLGAQNFPAAWRSMVTCLVLVTGLTGGMGLGFFVWRYPLVGLFTHDPAVVALAVHLLMFVALFQLCDGVGLIAMGVLRGAGNTRWPMLAGLLLNWGVFVPAVALTIFTWHGGIIAGWTVALGAAMVSWIVLLLRVLCRAW
jgi:multidrug resistance protein, MATE family